jgi:hypothetical protein
MIYTASGSLPTHQYVWVDSSYIRNEAKGYERAVWFGLNSHPGRAWGCHVMLECGAVYRNLPPNAIAFSPDPIIPDDGWFVTDAQVWNCYGRQFSLHCYDYLSGLQVILADNSNGLYLFTAIPFGDGFSDYPEQSKEFMFMQTRRDRLLIRPTNMVLFEERSFTRDTGWPTDIRTATKIWECESDA